MMHGGMACVTNLYQGPLIKTHVMGLYQWALVLLVLSQSEILPEQRRERPHIGSLFLPSARQQTLANGQRYGCL